MHNTGHLGDQCQSSRQYTALGSLVDKDQIVATEGYQITRDGGFHVRRIVRDIGTDHIFARLDAHGSDSCQIGRKGLGLMQVEKVKIKPVSRGINGQDVFSNGGIPGQGHFQGGQSLFAFGFISFLSQLYHSVPCLSRKIIYLFC
jgi:hypothetical protein